MNIEWTVSVGNLLTALTLLITGFGCVIALIRRIDAIEYRVEIIWHWFEENVFRRLNGKASKDK